MPNTPKPKVLKERDGNTRKLSQQAFEAELAGGHDVRPGRPAEPREFIFRPRKDEDEFRAAARKSRLERARAHWDELVDELGADGLLFRVDFATLKSAAMLLATMDEAFESGDARVLADLAYRYNQFAQQMGMTAAARSKLTIGGEKRIDDVEAALSGYEPKPIHPPVN